MSTEFMEGAIYTLLAILLGCVVGALVAVVVLADRGDPGPGSEHTEEEALERYYQQRIREIKRDERPLYLPFESDLRT